MSLPDLESLLRPVSDTDPSGPDLEYDATVAELEQAVKVKPEQQYGSTIIPAEEPDWKTVHKLAIGLLSRTKDIRIVTHLGDACLANADLAGFRDVTILLNSFVRDYWTTVYPKLDETDDDDPTERINAVAALRNPATLRLLKNVPIVKMQGVGQFSLLDVEIARGDIPSQAGDAPTMATIQGVFQDCDLSTLVSTLETLVEIETNLTAVETGITNHVGVSNSISLDPLTEMAGEMKSQVSNAVNKRRSESDDGPASPTSDTDASEGIVAVAEKPVTNGEIRGREDVIRAIDRICDYYDKYEPSSPLPLLLKRAKRLATKSFLEIIQDLTPDAIDQAQQIGGSSSGEDD